MPRKESTTKDKKCGKCAEKVHPGNDPSWYTREGLGGMIGANFNALSTVNDMAIGSTKIKPNYGVRYRTLIGCPSDVNGSFMKMMALMYAEIREKNSGAANYNPRILGAYVHDLMTLRAMYVYACRALAATRSSQPGNADSPYYLTGVATIYPYSDLSGNMANYANALRLIGKDMSVLPIPQITMFQREEFLYGRIFADSNNAKASMMAFVPSSYIQRVSVKEDGSFDYGVVQADMPSDFGGLITLMQNMLINLSSDPVITILRGDLIKAYGYVGMDMSTYVDRPLQVEYNRSVLSQIENMNILFTTVTVSEQKIFTLNSGNLLIAAGAGPAVPQRAVDTEWLINFHDGMSPDNGTLLSITRNMAYVDSESKVWTSGDLVLNVDVINKVDPITGAIQFMVLGTTIGNINSTTQTTAENALRTLANIASVVDGFPWIWTGSGDERGSDAYIWDIDMWAALTRSQLEQMNEQSIRSLFYYRAPRVDGMIKPGRL